MPSTLPALASSSRMVRIEAQAAGNVASRLDPGEAWRAERAARAYGVPVEALGLGAIERERDRLTVGAARGVRL